MSLRAASKPGSGHYCLPAAYKSQLPLEHLVCLCATMLPAVEPWSKPLNCKRSFVRVAVVLV